MFSAVPSQITLPIAVDVQPPHRPGAFHRTLPYRGMHRAAAPGHILWQAHIHRQQPACPPLHEHRRGPLTAAFLRLPRQCQSCQVGCGSGTLGRLHRPKYPLPVVGGGADPGVTLRTSIAASSRIAPLGHQPAGCGLCVCTTSSQKRSMIMGAPLRAPPPVDQEATEQSTVYAAGALPGGCTLVRYESAPSPRLDRLCGVSAGARLPRALTRSVDR